MNEGVDVEFEKKNAVDMVDGLADIWVKGRTGIKIWRRATRREGERVGRAWRRGHRGRPQWRARQGQDRARWISEEGRKKNMEKMAE